MPSKPEGLAIALVRIADEKNNRTGFLDLGRLGLTDVPEELFELEHLRGLNWGAGWFDEQLEWHDAESDLDPNLHANLLLALHRVPGLAFVSLAGTEVSDLSPLSGIQSLQTLICNSTPVSDLSPLSGIQSLQTLICNSTPVSDLSPLSGLQSLQTLDCNSTPVSDLSPLSGLQSLQTLNCDSTEVSDLSPLSGLQSLQTLDCNSTPVSDLSPLSGLQSLQTLNCNSTEVSDLSPLSGLQSLQTLDCNSTPVSDLSPLSGLQSLQTLNCNSTEVSDLSPLPSLQSLQTLYCSSTPVSDLSPLSGLQSLQTLYCSSTPVRDLSPLSGLQSLQTLYCSSTPVRDLSPLSGLQSLQTLNCTSTPVSDLSPLSGLQSLQTLYCSSTPVRDLSPLSGLQSLQTLSCNSTPVRDLSPLSGLQSLQTLNCDSTPVSDLSPLSGLQSLQTLNCDSTPVSDLSPLSGLQSLQTLYCSSTPVRDLSPLSGLQSLQTLSCTSTSVSDLSPLSGLQSLQTLDCNSTPVSDLSPLAGLQSLQTLNCNSTPVSDLSPLSGLQSLQSLNVRKTQVRDVSPLAGLNSLQSLVCWDTSVSDLSPLAGLPSLQSLDCDSTPVSDLSPLAGLPFLQSLDCQRTRVSDLSPLSSLQSLQSLCCTLTQVSDLRPLSGLQSLQTLNCSSTPVSDLSPLSGLQSLQTLFCSSTPVSDLSPLSGLQSLRTLYCSSTPVSELPKTLVWLHSLKDLCLCETRITDIPAEVLSPDEYTDCLESLRAHLRDLEEGEERLPDVKALVLGNGRIGKTQICRRLRGEDFQPDADSTHGITVKKAMLPMPQRAGEEARLHLWDFGGQDLYHGTHALFMRTRSIFLLAWTQQSENSQEHPYRGMTFRNHRLAYWLEYVRLLSGMESPVIIVQNMCDQPADEARHSPVEDKALGDFRFHKELHYSALNNRGYGTLQDMLQQAVQWQWDTFGRAKIGKGRLAVKRKLEALRDEDASLAADQRKFCTLRQEFFNQLCTDAGGVSNPALLLDYLHHVGLVFYQKGLFDNSIVLDQEWALQAVYAVFQREKCYRQLRDAHGRFTRSLLDVLVWGEYGVEEQKLFLSFMQSCGVCFVHRQEDPKRAIETEYIAPDLLPGRDEVAMQLEAMWRDEAPRGELVVELSFLHPGVLRGIISRIGNEAGISALYWKYGVCLYEGTTHSRALIEQRSSETPTTWSGQILVSTRGGQAMELLERLKKWIGEELTRSGCRDAKIIEPMADKPRSARSKRSGRKRAVELEPEDAVPALPLKFSAPPSDAITYCVSYAWNDESKAVVDRLCEQSKQRGITILRDTDRAAASVRASRGLCKGSQQGDRVFVILSDKYLKSTKLYVRADGSLADLRDGGARRCASASGSSGRRMPR